MKAVIISVSLVASTLATLHPVNHEIVSEIKKMKTTWTPMEPEENPFAYKSIEEIKAMMGTKHAVEDEIAIDYGFEPNDSFDARTHWPGKIHAIRDHGKCGSDWAFSVTDALSDRWAIEGKDRILSPQHMISCDDYNEGCNGGYISRAWKFMRGNGVVSDDCYPYRSGTTGETGTCYISCPNRYSEWKISMGTEYVHPRSVSSIQQEIQANGPIVATFDLYQDFINYKSGIYQYKTGQLLGAHAVKCLGWGTEGGVDYWLMANSWGTKWGDKGFFKIKRGECCIECEMYGARPDHSCD